MSFADNLRAAMERANVSQSELARRLGIRSQAVNQWFKPQGTAPRGRRLAEVAAAVGVELSDLLGDANAAKQGAATPEEQAKRDLLAAFDAMDQRGRETLLRIAQTLQNNDPPTPKVERTPTPPLRTGGRVKEKPAAADDCVKPALRVVAGEVERR
jgi:transcriptional regulator with XRE-family HTH domain